MSTIDFPISVSYQGELLIGKINLVNNYLVATLTSPFVGQKSIHYGWAASVCGVHVLDYEGNFTEDAIGTARSLLIKIYQQAQPEYKAREKEKKLKELRKKIEEVENE